MNRLLLLLCFLAFTLANKTLVKKCCGAGEALVDDTCEIQQGVKLLSTFPVFTSSGVLVQVKSEDLLQNLTTCHEGFRVVANRSHFKAFENGTLKTNHEWVLGDFCLNEDITGSLVARYCSVEPCAGCVKKCCASNMAFHDGPDKGKCLPPHRGRAYNRSSFIGNVTKNAIGSMRPVCKYDSYALKSFEYSIAANGSLVGVEDLDGYVTDEYCIENFVGESEEQDDVIALLCFESDTKGLSEEDSTVISIFPYLLFVSSIFLIATFIVYLILPRLRNVHGLTIMCYSLSLTMLYIGLGINQLKGGHFSETRCNFHACIVHFAFLSSFTWLNVMSLDIWLTLKNIKPRKSRYGRGAFGKRFAYYATYAWGLPLFIVAIGQILQKQFGYYHDKIITPSFGKETCWFPRNEAGPFWLYLYGPIATLIVANLVFFLLALRIFYQANVDNVFANNHARTKQKFRVISSLFFLMGISWTAEVISFAVGGSAYIWLTFDIINILTGVFIFVIFVCKPSVWKLLTKKFPRLAALDPCCPKFMTTQEAYGNVRSSEYGLKQKLSTANSNASNKRVSMQTNSTTDGASKKHSSLTIVDKKDRNSTQSNQSSKV